MERQEAIERAKERKQEVKPVKDEEEAK